MSVQWKIGLVVVMTAFDARAQPAVKVSGVVNRAGVHCGGAMLTTEQAAAITSPRPESGHHLLVRTGKENSNSTPVAEVVTDRNGRFSLSLVPGTYCVVEEAKRKASPVQLPRPTAYQTIDKACFERAAKTCDAVWIVTSSGLTDVNITFQSYCPWAGPCVQYSGPLPPAAAHGPAQPSRDGALPHRE